MSRHLFLDRVVACVGAFYILAVIASRWEAPKGQPWAVAPRLATSAVLLTVFVLTFFFSKLAPDKYDNYRPAVIALLKSMPMVLTSMSWTSQVRLNQPPSGLLAVDMFNAAVGLRVALVALVGLWQQAWWLWIFQQAILVILTANCEVDCSSLLLSHPLTAQRISKFNEVMHAMALPQLHRMPGRLLPKSQSDQCKVAVTFLGLLLGIVLPGLLLLPPRPPGQDAETCRWKSRCIELLLILKFQGGHRWVAAWTLLAWWALLAFLWVCSALYIAGQYLDLSSECTSPSLLGWEL